MEAAASPLPSDETTPPVMKMYLGVRRSMILSWLARWRGHQPPDLLQILRRVDAERFVRALDGLDADAVFERAQLLERLGALERRRFERREHEQRTAAVRVQTDMSVHGRPAAAGIPDVRNRRAREVHREAAAIDDDLGDIRIRQLGRLVDAPE